MLIKFKTAVQSFKGQPYVHPDKTEVSVGHIAVSALLEPGRRDSGEQVRRARLARRIDTALDDTGELDITPEDVVFVKDAVGTAITDPQVVFCAFEVLDGRDLPEPKPADKAA